MNYSVKVDNNSGAVQTVAVFMTDPAGGGYSLVWSVKKIPSTGSATFCWDDSAFGLGWGTSARPLDYGLQYDSGQAPVAVDPFAVQGDNTLPIGYDDGFVVGQPYCDTALKNSVNIVTDRSFTVGAAALMSVALYLDCAPALAMRGAPNTVYTVDLGQIVYYLTVTNAAAGVALRPPASPRLLRAAVSASVPVRIPFGPGATQLRYTLDATLGFRPVPSA